MHSHSSVCGVDVWFFSTNGFATSHPIPPEGLSIRLHDDPLYDLTVEEPRYTTHKPPRQPKRPQYSIQTAPKTHTHTETVSWWWCEKKLYMYNRNIEHNAPKPQQPNGAIIIIIEEMMICCLIILSCAEHSRDQGERKSLVSRVSHLIAWVAMHSQHYYPL